MKDPTTKEIEEAIKEAMKNPEARDAFCKFKEILENTEKSHRKEVAHDVFSIMRAIKYGFITEPEEPDIIEKSRKISELRGLLEMNDDEAGEIWEQLLQKAGTATKAEIESAGEEMTNAIIKNAVKVKAGENDYSIINEDPLTRKIIKQEGGGDVFFGLSPESGEPAIFNVISCPMTVYEIAIVESIATFDFSKQITAEGRAWFTVGQLYRALRQGPGTQSPTKKQKQALYEDLKKLRSKTIAYKTNEAMRSYGGFLVEEGDDMIISFDARVGTLRGQPDMLIILHDTPLLNKISKNLKMREVVSHEVKAIKYMKNGKEEAWTLTKDRIAIRTVLETFVFGYIRALGAGNEASNKIRYEDVFKRCGIGNRWTEIKRGKEAIAIIMHHFVKNINMLEGWKEYSNKPGGEPVGIAISVKAPSEAKVMRENYGLLYSKGAAE